MASTFITNPLSSPPHAEQREVLWLPGSTRATHQVYIARVTPPLSGSSVKAGAMRSRKKLADGLAQARKSLGQVWLFPLYHQLGVNSSTSPLFQIAGHGTPTAYTVYECLLCPAGRASGRWSQHPEPQAPKLRLTEGSGRRAYACSLCESQLLGLESNRVC